MRESNHGRSPSTAAPVRFLAASQEPLQPQSQPTQQSPESSSVAGGGCSRTAATGASTTDASAALWSRPHEHVGGLTNHTLRHCYDALSMIDVSQRKGWEVAKERCCPKVLAHESCPCYFMAACQANPWDAAERLCTYWNERIDLFEDRAFAAITSGTEASGPTGLTPQDVKILETGTIQLLPLDRQGRSVYFADLSRLEPHMHRDVKGRLRVLWYVLHKTFTSREPEAHRLVSIILCVRPERTVGFDWPYASGCMKIPTTLPIQTEDIHLLTSPASTGTGRFAQLVIATAINMIGGFFQHLVRVHHGAKCDSDALLSVDESSMLTGGRAVVLGDDHNNDPQERLLLQLRQHGLSKRGLPQCAGGNVTRDAFDGWLKRQRRIEEQLYWSDAQRAQRKRDLNRIHSRQKRIRRHNEFRELQNEVYDLQRANGRAREVHAELLALLDKAKEIVRSPSLHQVGTVHATAAPGHIGPDSDDLNSQSLSHFLKALEPDPIAPSCVPVALLSKSADLEQSHLHFETTSLESAVDKSDPWMAIFGQGCDDDLLSQKLLRLPMASNAVVGGFESSPNAIPDGFLSASTPSCESVSQLASSRSSIHPQALYPPPSGNAASLQQHVYITQSCLPHPLHHRSNVFNFTTTIQVNHPQHTPLHVTNCFVAGGEQSSAESFVPQPTLSVAFHHANPVSVPTTTTTSGVTAEGLSTSPRKLPVQPGLEPFQTPAENHPCVSNPGAYTAASSLASWCQVPDGHDEETQEDAEDQFDDAPFDTVFR